MLELSAHTRDDHLAVMAERTFDVLVVGGGITGAGVALDAAARGLSVALVERDDFAAGTSGRSSRLVHGGIRYLRHAELGLVYESLRERAVLRRLAPHLVRPLGFLVPVRGAVNRAYLGLGLAIYDALALGRNIAPHRWAGPEEVATLAPTLARRSGGYLSFDCRTDDARLTLEVVRTAVSFGAVAANHAGVTGLLGEGRVRGATVRDQLAGRDLEVRARTTVNAAGVWADRLLRLAWTSPPRLRPSKGVHVVLPRHRLPIRSAVTVPSLAGGGAMVFAIPWGPRVYAGTTDTPYAGPLREPSVDPEDIAVVVGSLGRMFGGDLGPADVRAAWAGVRPLLDTGKGSTRDLSRRHVVTESPPGLITVTGGKLTTYRAMAQHVVDGVARALGRGRGCATSDIPLGLTRSLQAELGRAASGAARLGLGPQAGRRLVFRYGDDWGAAAALIGDDPDLGHEAVPGLPVLRVELEMARTREMAMTDEDVLERRTRLATMDRKAAGPLTAGPRPGTSAAGEAR